MKNSPIEVKTPQFAESIEQAVVLAWKYKVGDAVKEGEVLVELETDKVVLEVPAPVSGVIEKIVAKESTEVKAEAVLAIMVEKAASAQPSSDSSAEKKSTEGITESKAPEEASEKPITKTEPTAAAPVVTPSARKEAVKHEVNPSELAGSGKKGRVVKEDIVNAGSTSESGREVEKSAPTETKITPAPTKPLGAVRERSENVVPISRLRAKVAERLLASQHQTATLTTFNEANMQAVMDLRKTYQDQFVAKYGIKLGFMSFFTLASVHALKRYPSVNAYFQHDKIVYHDYCDIGIAMSTERGLMVPILKDADLMNFADVEKAIVDFAQKAKQNKIEIGDLQGGTFSITNGGIFGSLLSTPILNPPQSAILGLHAINPTPVVENGEIVVRPVMKLALSYDHRIIDGREAVSFLVAVKEMIENPVRMLFDI